MVGSKLKAMFNTDECPAVVCNVCSLKVSFSGRMFQGSGTQNQVPAGPKSKLDPRAFEIHRLTHSLHQAGVSRGPSDH